MKTWFVYEINGKRIATWANNNKEAIENLRTLYGDADMKYVGIWWSNGIGEKPDEYTNVGMTPTDTIIASGILNQICQWARYGFMF